MAKQKLMLNVTMHIQLIYILISLCLAEIYALGSIYPRGAISVNVGGDIEMKCTVDLKQSGGKNSTHLSFFAGNMEIQKKYIEILNETTILLIIKHAEPMRKKFVCKLDKDGVDYRQVYVGYPPGKVENFQCRSDNYENFVCTFKMPDNYVPTRYKLTYAIKSQHKKRKNLAEKRRHDFQVYECELEGDRNGMSKCNISLENGQYRQVYEFYNFTLHSWNGLGNFTENFTINHFDNVIPAKPIIRVENITSNSAILEWEATKSSLYKEKGLVYQAMILSEHGQNKWDLIDINKMNISRSNNICRIKIDNLSYAYTWYDFRIRVKVATAIDTEEMWSKTANYTFMTLPKKPDDPPKTDVGSFHIDSVGNIHLYWKTLPPYKENGPNIQYIITEVRQNGKLKDIKPDIITFTTAKFTLPVADYEFLIKSKNSLGLSNQASSIRVPAERFPEPQRLKKVYSQGKYILSWSAPETKKKITNYTVFWCERKSETSNQCEGTVNFTHFSPETRNMTYDILHTKPVNFAVSANSYNSSSGMIWTMCTALKDSDFGKIRPLLTLKSATTIKLEWSLECVYSSILEGYYLFYCPIKDPYSMVCTDESKVIRIPGEVKEYNLSNLKPYTTYKIVMSMFSATKQGPLSDPLLRTTMETAPSPPRRLVAKNITSNSVVLTWNSPQFLNGQLRYYEIVYNNEKFKVEGDYLSNETEIVHKLDSLRSFYNYKIYVIARTIDDSLPSNDISIRTAVGTPGFVEQPRAIEDDATMKIFWNQPAVPSGRIEFYEFKTEIFKDNIMVVYRRISRINGTNCKLRESVCRSSSHKYEFSVRAVNAIERIDGENESEFDYHTYQKRDVHTKYYQLKYISNISSELKNSNDEIIALNETYSLEPTESQAIFIHKNNKEIHQDEQMHRRHTNIQTYIDDDASSNFECEEEHDDNLIKWLALHEKNMRFLYGEWSKPSIHFCHYSSNSSKAIMILGSIFAFALMIVLMYFGCKKYKRMKNIIVVFPPGLTDLDQETRTKGVDNIISKDDINRSDESLFKNENHHLLANNRLEPGYIDGINGSDKNLYIINSLDYNLNTDSIQTDDRSGQSDTVEMSDISDTCNSSPSQSPTINSRDQNITSNQILNPLIINGYVQHQSFQKQSEPTASSDYTQLDAFGKPIIIATTASTINETKHKDNSMINENICGYVTHKQLSEFGHRLQ